MAEDRSARTAIPWLPIAATLGIATLVGISSRGAPVWRELSDGQTNRAELLDRVAEVGMFGLIVAAAITITIHYLVVARRPGAPLLRQTLLRAIPITLISVALLVLLAIARGASEPERVAGGAMQMDWFSGLGLANGPLDADGLAGTAPPPAGGEGTAPQAVGVSPPLLMLLLAVIAAIAGAMLWSWRPDLPSRRPLALQFPAPPMDAERSRARESLTETIEAMLADPDPRRAIIGAYARLLESLAGRDAARRDFEGPREHLQRTLARLRVPAEPLRRLVELFELARFSDHPLTESHRQEALRALRSALADPPGPTPAALGSGGPRVQSRAG